MSELPEDTDVVVIGAGPAGAAAAAAVADAGLHCLVLERATFPRFSIGESLIPHCNDLLAEAGFLDDVAAAGFVRKPGAIFVRGERRAQFDFARGGGHPYTWQVERADFDHLLIENVQRRGVEVVFGATVQGATFEQRPTLTVACDEGAPVTVTARHVIDASGYGRVLPRLLGLESPSSQPVRASMFAHVVHDAPPSRSGHVWLVELGDAAWAWLIPLRGGRTSFGAVAAPAWFEALPGEDARARLRAIIERDATLREQLAGAELALGPIETRGFAVSVARRHGPGWTLAGNSPEFVDPILSSGVMLALRSGLRAGRLAGRELRGNAVDWDGEFVAPTEHATRVFTELVDAWYDGLLQDVLYADDPPPRRIRQLTRVLAGYVDEPDNPFARHPTQTLKHVRRKLHQARRLGLTRR